jgi:hypothetical protein
VIRDAVIHLTSEQPLLCDLFSMPRPNDSGLVCTNIRSLDGRRPIFVDHTDSTFFFPYLHVRFLEIPKASAVMPVLPAGDSEAMPDQAPQAAPIPAGAANGHDATNGTDDGDLELDEDFLRRVREV